MSEFKVGDWVMCVYIYKPELQLIGQIHRKDGEKFWLYKSILGNMGSTADFEWFVPDSNTWSKVVVLGKEEVSHGA